MTSLSIRELCDARALALRVFQHEVAALRLDNRFDEQRAEPSTIVRAAKCADRPVDELSDLGEVLRRNAGLGLAQLSMAEADVSCN